MSGKSVRINNNKIADGTTMLHINGSQKRELRLWSQKSETRVPRLPALSDHHGDKDSIGLLG